MGLGALGLVCGGPEQALAASQGPAALEALGSFWDIPFRIEGRCWPIPWILKFTWLMSGDLCLPLASENVSEKEVRVGTFWSGGVGGSRDARLAGLALGPCWAREGLWLPCPALAPGTRSRLSAVTVICAAPGVDGAWWRAQVVAAYEDTNEVEIRYVDYGGYKRVKVDVLRQIR